MMKRVVVLFEIDDNEVNENGLMTMLHHAYDSHECRVIDYTKYPNINVMDGINEGLLTIYKEIERAVGNETITEEEKEYMTRLSLETFNAKYPERVEEYKMWLTEFRKRQAMLNSL